MTTTTEAARNPLADLKPLVVIGTNNYATSVVLDADAVTRDQRDAAIAYLNGLIGSSGSDSSFKLESTGAGGRYALNGTTGSLYTGSDEFREAVKTGIQPEFHRVGTLKVEIVRASRHMVGVECVLTATSRGTDQAMPTLANKPDEVIGLDHSGTTVAFSLKNLVKEVDGKPTMVTDAELIGDALRVAKKFGVFVEQPPTKVTDPDPRARLYPRFNLPEAGGEG